MNTAETGFITALAAILGGDPLRETLLLAPTHRVGRQWLDRVALFAGRVANVRPVTMPRLARDLAEPILRQRGLVPASAEEKIHLIGVAMAGLARETGHARYFTLLPPSLALAETLLAAVEELETARLPGTAAPLRNAIDSRDKADELAALMRSYRSARRRAGLAGTDDIHRAAAEAAAEAGAAAPFLIIPEMLLDDFTLLERDIFKRWPAAAQCVVPGDSGDCGADIHCFAADSVMNEAREIFRRIQAASLPLDSVEIVCLDRETYVPALCAAAVETFGGRLEDVPLTCNSGFPVWHSRPGRLLTAWLEWLNSGLPPEGLARILDAGLLDGEWGSNLAAQDLAARLRALPIAGAPDEYRRRLREAAKNDAPALARAEKWLERFLAEAIPAVPREARPEKDAPVPAAAPAASLLAAARSLLEAGRDRDAKLDAYARSGLLDAIGQWLPYCDWPGFNAMEWLASLAAGLRVMGLGPLPGKVYISELPAGGHSGRECLFVAGLDESRFPGAPRQDPVLLDKERPKLSAHLPKSGHWRRRREKALERLLAGARGTLFLSHAKSAPGSRRELFPAGIFIEAARRAAAPKTAGLIPDAPEKCLSRRDDWLRLMLDAPRNSLTPEDLRPWHPHLARGALAEAARLSDRFGPYDGYVPEAGADFFAGPEARIFSPSALERFAACPLEFFFSQALRVAPPDRSVSTPGRWLEGNERGSLLHDLFQAFLETLLRDNLDVTRENFAERNALLRTMLAAAIDAARRRRPPEDSLAFQRETKILAEACDIFLIEEVERQARGRPLYLELPLGSGEEGALLAAPGGAVDLPLPSGRTVRLRGRLDRIDRLRDHGGLAVVDYKTGRADKFSQSDPFSQGRTLQPFLYVRMLEKALADRGLPEPVRRFTYFFPMPAAEGRNIVYERAALETKGPKLLEHLAELLANGCFPFTTSLADVTYSEYADAFGGAIGVKDLTLAAKAKAVADPLLSPWRALREM